ncbi:unannotated protein [freshwater metagenome]|uniref:Unannotated protein n=1 Tax=freshwater metagenome TaxID=449393 RepID=A0A6J7NRK4_9ZZZZ
MPVTSMHSGGVLTVAGCGEWAARDGPVSSGVGTLHCVGTVLGTADAGAAMDSAARLATRPAMILSFMVPLSSLLVANVAPSAAAALTTH